MKAVTIIALLGVALLATTGVAYGVPPAFSNQTAAAGLSSASHQISGISNSNYVGGCAVGDFNGDGFQDLFFTGGGDPGKVDRLYINNGNGTFTDQAPAWGVAAVHKGKGAAVGDYDKDGDLDLFVISAGTTPASGSPGQHKLYRNNGDNTFTNVAAAAGVNFSNPTQQDGWSGNFVDYDLDGDLDLFVSGSYGSNAGSRLFRNNGNGTFTDVTAVSGPGGTNMWPTGSNMFGFTPLFADMDGDRYPDLIYVADFGTSRYFKNNGNGTFTNVTTAGAAQEENGMGGNLGDWDNDGRMDYYVTSIYLPTSGWTGNKLYRNISNGVGDHHFLQLAGSAVVADGGYGWGTVLVDFNHDTLLDIAATDGAPTPPFINEQTYLWVNDGDGTFTEMAVASGLVHNGLGRALVNFDFDNDGDEDIAICNNNQNLKFFRNDLPAGPDTHWLRVFLKSDRSTIPPNGMGSIVRVVNGPLKMTRLVHGGGFQSTSELSAHFGLGATTSVADLRIEWTDATITVLHNVAANQTITLCSHPGDMNADGFVDGRDIPEFTNVQLGIATAPGAIAACAEYGQGSSAGNIAAFVADLLE